MLGFQRSNMGLYSNPHPPKSCENLGACKRPEKGLFSPRGVGFQPPPPKQRHSPFIISCASFWKLGTVSIGGCLGAGGWGVWGWGGGVSRSIKLGLNIGIRNTGRVVGCPKKKNKNPKPPLVFFLRCALLSSTASSPPSGFVWFFCTRFVVVHFVLPKVTCSHSFLCLQHFYSFFSWIFCAHYGFSCTKSFFFCGVRYRLILSSLFLDCFPFLVHIPVQQGLLDLNNRLVCWHSASVFA
jgi:hypothetical protein